MKPLFIILPALAVLAVAAVAFWLWRRHRRENEDILSAVVGASAVVTDQIAADAGGGSVSFRGTEWAARAVSPELSFEEGQTVTVVAVEGVKLICR